MRIAQLAPLWELVPPRTYGGTELVVHLLTEELVKRGHQVTLFASTGSQTSASLVSGAPMALRDMEERFKKDKTHCTVMGFECGQLQNLFNRMDGFDIIHNHMGFQPLTFSRFLTVPMVTTLHNALDPEPVRRLFYRNAHLPYISISNYQQRLWPRLNYAGTIYHGIDLGRFDPYFHLSPSERLDWTQASLDENRDGNQPGSNELSADGYFVFLGRLSPEKGPHHAITVAKALGKKLIMAGKIDRVDQEFYDTHVAPFVDGRQIIYIGEVNHRQKVALLRKAAATLCPVEWPEPFGLVMIESMACGTPVFALRDGSTPEVIDQGVTGYVCDTVEELIEAARQYWRYDRRQVRAMAERRFSVERMVDDHLALYTQLIERHHAPIQISDKAPSVKTRVSGSTSRQPLTSVQAVEQCPLPLSPASGAYPVAVGEAPPLERAIGPNPLLPSVRARASLTVPDSFSSGF